MTEPPPERYLSTAEAIAFDDCSTPAMVREPSLEYCRCVFSYDRRKLTADYTSRCASMTMRAESLMDGSEGLRPIVCLKDLGSDIIGIESCRDRGHVNCVRHHKRLISRLGRSTWEAKQLRVEWDVSSSG